MYTLRLLGGITLAGPDGPLSGRIAHRKRLALLALTRNRALSRDKLVAYFWPESDAERGRHMLSHCVYLLRKQLGEDVFVMAGDDIRLNPGAVRADVDAFEEAYARRDWKAAAGAYAGPFLDGFFLSDAVEFERWVECERDRLARCYADALEALALGAERNGNAPQAVAWWHRLADHDPLDSRIAVRLMAALVAAGDRAGALRHGRRHAALLRRELELDPDPAVTTFLARLHAASAPDILGAGPRRSRRASSGS